MFDDEREMRERMSLLAESLPSLAGKPGVRPWDPERLDRWAREGKLAAAELHAARFALNVWDGKREWRSGRFDFLDALDHWDEHHRAAFAAWTVDPWWPLLLRSRPAPPEESAPDTLPTILVDRSPQGPEGQRGGES